MRKVLTILFLNCLILSMAAAGDTGNDGNAPQEPAQSPSVTAPVPDSNEPNMLHQQQINHQAAEMKNRRHGKMAQAVSEHRLAKGRNHARQFQAFETQLAEEYLKHNKRIATLNRIRQLAEEENLSKTVERADSLIKMENDRHMKKVTRLHRESTSAVEKSEKGRKTKVSDVGTAETNEPNE
jgi:hypothetical protein